MGIDDIVKKWMFNIAVKKAIKSAAKLIVSYCATKGIILVLTIAGQPVDTGNMESIEAALTLGINSGLTVLRNWLKHKYPDKFGFL